MRPGRAAGAHQHRPGLHEVARRLVRELAARREPDRAVDVHARAVLGPRLRDRLVLDGRAGNPHLAERSVGCLFWTGASREAETRLRDYLDEVPPGEMDVRRVYAMRCKLGAATRAAAVTAAHGYGLI